MDFTENIRCAKSVIQNQNKKGNKMSNKEQLHEAELILEIVLDKEASREYLKGLTTTYFDMKKLRKDK